MGISGTLNAVSGLDSKNGAIGDIVRRYSSSSDVSLETRNKCGPLGPSTGFCGANWKSNSPKLLDLGVVNSSYEDNVVSLLRPAFKDVSWRSADD